MNITDYILKDFKPLTLKCKIDKAKKLCENLPITHIPVVEDGKLLGCFSQSDIRTIEDIEQTVENFTDLFYQYHSDTTSSTLELLSIFADNDANIIPVISENSYIGYIELADILDVFSSTPFLANDGFILIVQKNNIEYSMSEISQIIESNNGVLLGAYQSEMTTDVVTMTLKIASQEINEIIQTFRRYNYLIITEHKDDFYLEDLKNRSDYLQKFLNT